MSVVPKLVATAKVIDSASCCLLQMDLSLDLAHPPPPSATNKCLEVPPSAAIACSDLVVFDEDNGMFSG